jgi:DNA-binding NarL/FixJ family response regulator
MPIDLHNEMNLSELSQTIQNGLTNGYALDDIAEQLDITERTAKYILRLKLQLKHAELK